jgi:hypothetical protein
VSPVSTIYHTPLTGFKRENFTEIRLQIVLKTIFSSKNAPTMQGSSFTKCSKAEKGDKKGTKRKI